MTGDTNGNWTLMSQNVSILAFWSTCDISSRPSPSPKSPNHCMEPIFSGLTHSLLISRVSASLTHSIWYPSPCAASTQQCLTSAPSFQQMIISLSCCLMTTQTSQRPHSPTSPTSEDCCSTSPERGHPSMHTHVGYHQFKLRLAKEELENRKS